MASRARRGYAGQLQEGFLSTRKAFNSPVVHHIMNQEPTPKVIHASLEDLITSLVEKKDVAAIIRWRDRSVKEVALEIRNQMTKSVSGPGPWRRVLVQITEKYNYDEEDI